MTMKYAVLFALGLICIGGQALADNTVIPCYVAPGTSNCVPVSLLHPLPTTGGGSIMITNSGLFTLNGAISSAGTFTQNGAGVNSINANIEILKAPILDISSTHIRELIKERKSIKFLVPDIVKEEIENNRYYRE